MHTIQLSVTHHVGCGAGVTRLVLLCFDQCRCHHCALPPAANDELILPINCFQRCSQHKITFRMYFCCIKSPQPLFTLENALSVSPSPTAMIDGLSATVYSAADACSTTISSTRATKMRRAMGLEHTSILTVNVLYFVQTADLKTVACATVTPSKF
jgi:hypothetical protein